MDSYFSLTIVLSNSLTPNKFEEPPVTMNPPFTLVNPKSTNTSNTSSKISCTVLSITALKSFEYTLLIRHYLRSTLKTS